MTHLRRNWRLIVVVAVLAVASGLHWGLSDRGQALADPEPPGDYDPVTSAQRDGILSAMEEVGLDRDAVVALNVSSEQAETMVSAARTWWEQNGDTLAGLKATVHQRQAELRAVRLAIRMGPAEAGQDQTLSTAISNLLTARAAYQTALNPLRSAVATGLSESQEAAWASVERGHSERMPIRLLDLSSDQRVAVGNAWRDYRLAYAGAATAQARAAAATAWETALAATLTDGQEDVVDAYLGYWVASSEAVSEALDTVLAVEDA